MKLSLVLLLASTTAFAALPAVGPDYQRPAVASPIAWKVGTVADALPRGEWWKLFADPALDALETRALTANQDLRAAAARVEQARAAAGIARSGYWPQLAVSPSVTRERTSAPPRTSRPTRSRRPTAHRSSPRGNSISSAACAA